MSTVLALIRRNMKLFFRDKGMFFTSLITPLILLVLYATFLGKVYRDSFLSALPAGLPLAEELIDGCVGGQLISSILAVSCVTVAFCSNMLMVQDKASGSAWDFLVSPVKGGALAVGYYVATFFSSLLICAVAMAVCLVWLATMGWYLTLLDVLLLGVDVMLLVMFGTALSSFVNFFLSTQGQISAVGTVVSSGYGFLCGAYMPISQFSEGLQRVIMLLPGTYGTSLIRNHAMGGAFAEMEAKGVPAEAIAGIREAVDCRIYFSGNEVGVGSMYAVLGGWVILLLGAYVLLNILRARKSK